MFIRFQPSTGESFSVFFPRGPRDDNFSSTNSDQDGLVEWERGNHEDALKVGKKSVRSVKVKQSSGNVMVETIFRKCQVKHQLKLRSVDIFQNYSFHFAKLSDFSLTVPNHVMHAAL